MVQNGCCAVLSILKGVVINYRERGGGEATQREVWASEVIPHTIRGALNILAILMGWGGGKKFPSFKQRRETFYPVLRVATSIGPAIFPFCSPPSP